MTRFLRTALVQGTVVGVLGTLAGAGLTMGIRSALEMPPWNAGPVTAVAGIFWVLFFLVGAGAFRDWWSWARGAKAGPPAHPDPETPLWVRILSFDPSHKVIGLQYGVTSVFLLFFAGLMALLMRTELARPGLQHFSENAYNAFMTVHGMVMITAILMGIGAMANYLIPLMIGARDMAFPRLNAFSYWVAVPGIVLVAASLFAGGMDTGWTAYPPLGVKAGLGGQFFYMGVFFVGLSSILGAVNYIVTILKLRAPGMTLFRMPIFVWGMLATSIIALTGTQFIGTAFLMVLLERLIGMGFFDPQKGGDPVLYQHIFWFYSHPAVYIFILPGLGVISELLPVFARKPLFGYRWVALSSMAIAIVGFLVWAHHMFTVGLGNTVATVFMFSTLLVAVPTGVKIFSWLGTLWGGKLSLRTPMLFVLGSLVIFLVGGLTGPFLALVPVNFYLHDTYWVVAHFHHTMFGGFVFPFLAAAYYWFPKVTGRMYDERLGKLHFWLMILGFHTITLPMFAAGLMGMRRRIADYDPALGIAPLHTLMTVGGYVVALSMLIFLYNVVRSAVAGERAPANPWGARTLEWQIPSPPPEENFATVPVIVGGPYDYGTPGSVHARLGVAGASGAEDLGEG